MLFHAQQILIRLFIKPLALRMERFSEGFRTRLFITAASVIILMHFLYTFSKGSTAFSEVRYFYVFAVDCLMLGIMTLAVLKSDFHFIPFDRALFFCGIGMGICMLIAGLTKDPNHLAAATLCLVIYPVIYQIWGNYDFSKISEWLIQSVRITFFVALAILGFFYPLVPQYGGFFYNPNGLAFYLTVVVCCLWSALLAAKETNRLCKLDIILFGIGCALLFYTNSRTGQLSVVTAVIVSLALLFCTDRPAAVSFLHKRFWITLVSVLICVFSLVFFSHGVTAILDCLRMFFEGASVQWATIWKLHIQQALDALNGIILTNHTKVAVGDRSMLRYSAGRLDIWKHFLSHIRLTGHACQDSFILNIEGQLTHSGTAHNTILEFAWQYGFFSGLLLFVFHVVAGLKTLLYAQNIQRNPYALFPIIITMAYGVTSMLSSVSSFLYMIALFYWLVQIPIITRSSTSASIKECAVLTRKQ